MPRKSVESKRRKASKNENQGGALKCHMPIRPRRAEENGGAVGRKGEQKESEGKFGVSEGARVSNLETLGESGLRGGKRT